MSKVDIQNGRVYYGSNNYSYNYRFYLPHSCNDWVIGNLNKAKKFLKDLQKTIKQVEELKRR